MKSFSEFAVLLELRSPSETTYCMAGGHMTMRLYNDSSWIIELTQLMMTHALA